MKRATAHSSDVSATKKKARFQCYRDEYKAEWPFFERSKISKNHVFCKTCGIDFSISHGGRDDCRRHATTKKHTIFEKLKLQTLDKHFGIPINDEVTRAELLFATFLVEHNLPIATADHSKQLFRAMFPDSAIAKKFSCARTKATLLIQNLAVSTTNSIVSTLQKNVFSLATDGSSDTKENKLYPIVVTYFDELKGRNSTVLLSLAASSDNTGRGIFNALNDEFEKKGIPWSNCLSFACDNAYTMIGSVKGVAAFIKNVHPSVIVARCSCHLLHLAAKRATSKLPFDFEQLIVKIFFYLDKSSKRKKAFCQSQELCNVEPHQILKCISTRWLSLKLSIDRILEQWEPLVNFFSHQLEKENSSQVQEIYNYIENPMIKLYCLFLSSVLPVFTSVNESLQQETPQIHKLKRKYYSLLMDLASRFINPSAISDNTNDLKNVRVEKRKNQKHDDDIVIGAKTRAFKDALELTNEENSSFYESIREFYVAAYSYIIKKFPLTDEFLIHIESADISIRKNARFSSIKYLSSLLNYSDEELDKLESEFSLYQNEIFTFDENERIDAIWNEISLIKSENGQLKYAVLSNLMKTVLTVPHSNAATERVFSIIRKNVNELRPNLGTENLNSILVEKLKILSDKNLCYERKFTKSELDMAKKTSKQM